MNNLERLIKKRLKREREKAPSDDVVRDPKQLAYHASLVLLVKDIGAILEKHFPGWRWVVQPDQRNMIIDILNWDLHDEWGFTIRTVEIHNDPKRRLAYRAGREILERFGMVPGALNDENKQRLLVAKRDRKGRLRPDAWDRMTRQQKEQQRITETTDQIERIVAHGGQK